MNKSELLEIVFEDVNFSQAVKFIYANRNQNLEKGKDKICEYENKIISEMEKNNNFFTNEEVLFLRS